MYLGTALPRVKGKLAPPFGPERSTFNVQR
ncbi:hypothetical protein BH18VER2_BH18VER2_02900 [soil metagenome]